MKNTTAMMIWVWTGLCLLTACGGQADMGLPGTPDPALMDILERTLWDFENFRQEMNELAAAAAATPLEDQEPVLRQMGELNAEISGYEFPLFAAKAHSALINFASDKSACYIIKYDVYINQMSDFEYDFFFGDYDRCERAQVFEETLDLYLQELREANPSE